MAEYLTKGEDIPAIEQAYHCLSRWGDTLPGWLKNTIPLERLAMNIKALKGEEGTGTDVEACAYLMTASLTQPLGHD